MIEAEAKDGEAEIVEAVEALRPSWEWPPAIIHHLDHPRHDLRIGRPAVRERKVRL